MMDSALHLGVKIVPPFRCPDPPPPESHLALRLRGTERRIKIASFAMEGNSLMATGADSSIVLTADIRNKLEHELSPYIEIMNRNRKRKKSPKEEITACCNIIRCGLVDIRDFEPFIFYIIKHVSVSEKSYRQIIVQTSGDNYGNRVQYPLPSLVPNLMSDLGVFINRTVTDHPLLAAIVAYAGITAIHPFRDGNGRTARIYFNCILKSALSDRFYLPIFQISGGCRGGLIIRMRDAHYNDNWSPLITFFCDAIDWIIDEYGN